MSNPAPSPKPATGLSPEALKGLERVAREDAWVDVLPASQEGLAGLLAGVDERMLSILEAHLGQGLTQVAIADSLGVSKSWAHVLVQKALTRIRRNLARHYELLEARERHAGVGLEALLQQPIHDLSLPEAVRGLLVGMGMQTVSDLVRQPVEALVAAGMSRRAIRWVEEELEGMGLTLAPPMGVTRGGAWDQDRVQVVALKLENQDLKAERDALAAQVEALKAQLDEVASPKGKR